MSELDIDFMLFQLNNLRKIRDTLNYDIHRFCPLWNICQIQSNYFNLPPCHQDAFMQSFEHPYKDINLDKIPYYKG